MSTNIPFLVIVTEEWGTFVKVKTLPSGEVAISGAMQPLLEVLAQSVPFRYNLTRPPDGKWGGRFPNGSYNGMFGMLERKEVDMALGPSSISARREEVSDFLVPILHDSVRMVYRKPQFAVNYTSFLQPFSFNLWIAVWMALFVVTVVHYFLTKASLQRKLPSASASFLQCFAPLPLQAMNLPESTSKRFLLFFWAISCFILAKSYEGLLTALMAIARVVIPITTLEDLVSQDEIPWRLEIASFLYDTFKFSRIPVEMEVFDGLAGTFIDCFTNRSEMVNGEFVAICDRSSIVRAKSWDYSSNGKCQLHTTTETLREVSMSIAMTSNHSLIPTMNIWLRRIFESGLFTKWLIEKDKSFLCDTKDVIGSKTVVVNMAMFSGFFLVLLVGYFISTIVFCAEFYWSPSRISKASKLKKQKTEQLYRRNARRKSLFEKRTILLRFKDMLASLRGP